MTTPDDTAVPLANYAKALDEIYALRTLLAYESAVRVADLDLQTYPRSRRRFALESIDRMRLAAAGRFPAALSAIEMDRRTKARADARMPQTLTREAWETQRGLTSDGAA